MNVGFNFSVYGLKVKFTNLSDDLSSKVVYKWQFGDGSESHELDPCHKYTEIGQYRVMLTAYDATTNEELGSYNTLLMVSDFIKTRLTDTIYNLINTYLPEEVFGKVNLSTKTQFIQKWQLYIQPIVNHLVPIEQATNELYYEALENQLIMELAAYDFIVNQINLTFQAISQTIKDNNEIVISSSSSSSSGGGGDTGETPSVGKANIKKITAGPTEVEYFDRATEDSDNSGNIVKAMQPGGILDSLKQNICMLAERLDIYLPMCSRPAAHRVVPKVVNRRIPGPLDGPDPLEIVK